MKTASRALSLGLAAALLVTARPAEAKDARLLHPPKLGWVIYSAAWVGGSIWAQPRTDFPHAFFSYVPATYTGLWLGATAGGLLGDRLATGQGNWGPAFAGMLIGGALGAGAGVALGYAASRNRVVYYATQGAYVSVVMFTLPLVSW